LLTQGKSHIIKAHDNGIQTFVLNSNGTLLATASDKGTLIRVWDTSNGFFFQ
jgi:WD repeat-containing protein 45